MPALTVLTHHYTKVVTTEMTSSGAGFRPTDHHETVVETVQADFKIHDGETVVKKSVRVHPEALHLTFRSINGDAWRVDFGGVRMVGSNIKKDGSLGAGREIRYYDFPAWLDKLYKPDADGWSDALDWVRAEYPR